MTRRELAEVAIKTRSTDGRPWHKGTVTLYSDRTVVTTKDHPRAWHTQLGDQLRSSLQSGTSIEVIEGWFRQLRGVKDCNLHRLPECEDLEQLAANPPLIEYRGRPLLGVGQWQGGKSWLVATTFDQLVDSPDRGHPKSWHKYYPERLVHDDHDLVLDTRPNRVLQNDHGQYVLCDADSSSFTRFDLVKQLDRWLRSGDVLAEGAVMVSKVKHVLSFRPVVWTPRADREAYVDLAVESLRSPNRRMRTEARHTEADRRLRARESWDSWFEPGGKWEQLRRQVEAAGGTAVVVDPYGSGRLLEQLQPHLAA